MAVQSHWSQLYFISSCTVFTCPTSILIITLVTIKCHHHHAVPFVFSNMASCRHLFHTDYIQTLLLHEQTVCVLVYWLFAQICSCTGHSHIKPFHVQFMKKKTLPCLENHAALVTHYFKSLMVSSHCVNPASRQESFFKAVIEGGLELNIASITKRCPSNISSVVNLSSCFYKIMSLLLLSLLSLLLLSLMSLLLLSQ